MLIRSILSSLRGAPSRAGVARLRSAPLSSAAAADSAESPMRRLRGDDFDAFERIVTSRRSSGTFDASRPIALDLLRRIFELTLRAPSSFNLCPFVLVAMVGDKSRASLADAMLGRGNRARVQTAPVSVVVLADLQPHRLLDGLVSRERAGGAPTSYLRNLEMDTAMLIGGGGGGGGGGGEGGGGVGARLGDSLAGAASAAKGALFSAVSLLAQQPMPTPDPVQAWAYKNAALAAQTLLLGATAAGLGTHVMEGFDGGRVLDACGVPLLAAPMALCSGGTARRRYAVPMVISIGYEVDAGGVAAGATAEAPQTAPSAAALKQPDTRPKTSTRPALEEIVRMDSF